MRWAVMIVESPNGAMIDGDLLPFRITHLLSCSTMATDVADWFYNHGENVVIAQEISLCMN